MAIGKGNGRHWIKAAVKRIGSQLEEMTAARQARLAHERAKEPRVAALLKRSKEGSLFASKTEQRPERKERSERFLKSRSEGKGKSGG